MYSIDDWAAKHPQAAADLFNMFTLAGRAKPDGPSEAHIQSAIQLEAPSKGYWLGRNNSGVLMNEQGVPVRFGLGNVSAAVNKVIKTGDLIGMKTVTITPDMVGQQFARFVSVEVKKPGGRIEKAQQSWAALVNKRGGLGLILNEVGLLP